ncbi:MAG: tetratricopeptide repeat protein [Myxococcota bacterium]|nr:tetratricopeptide repeat protein [Myxococcota bacterium]
MGSLSKIRYFLLTIGFLCGVIISIAGAQESHDGLFDRITRLKKQSHLAPNDRDANRRLRFAMMRAGRLDQLLSDQDKRRKKDLENVHHWSNQGHVILVTDPNAAELFFQECRDHVQQRYWCYFGEALAVEEQGRTEDALELLQLARAGRYSQVEMATAEIRLQLKLNEKDRAKVALKRLVVAEPKRPYSVRCAQIEFFLRTGDIERARTAIDKLKSLEPDDPAVILYEAKLHNLAQEPEKAALALQTAVSWNPDNTATRARLAKQLSILKRWKSAIAQYTVLVDKHPRKAQFLQALGEAHLNAGSPERALGMVTQILKEEKSSIPALELRMRALILLGHYSDALSLRPLVYDSSLLALSRRIRIAEALAMKGRDGQAEVEFTGAIAHHPRAPRAWISYADWFVSRRKLGRAEAILRRGLSVLPKAASLHASLAKTFEAQGYSSLAKKAYGAALDLAPREAEYANQLARLEFMSGAYLDAIRRWEQLIKAKRGDDSSLRNLSAAYRAMGAHGKAVKLVEQLVTRHPGDNELRQVLAELYIKLSRAKDAVRVLKQGTINSPKNAQFHALLGAALGGLGQVQDAEKHFQIALRLKPMNRPARLTYARFLEDAGKSVKASNLYKQQLARNASDADALAGLRRLIGRNETSDEMEQIRTRVAKGHKGLAELIARMPSGQHERGGTVLRDERYVTTSKRGIEVVKHIRSVMIHTEVGTKRYKRVSIAFHSQAKPKIRFARTLTPDGEVLDVPKTNIRYENPHANTPLFGDARQLVIDFPQAEPGAILDYDIETYRPQPDLGQTWWDSYILGNGDPTVRIRYVLNEPTATLSHIFAPGLDKPLVRQFGSRTERRWERYDLPGYKVSDAQESNVPAVFMSSLQNWADVDRWYNGLFEPQSRITSSVSIKAKEIGRRLSGRVDRIAAVYRFVEQNTKYLGVEFGIGAYRPRPAESTLAQGQGDCKDMTALMVALLKQLGIKSYPALIRPVDQGVFIPEHPAPGQFSHVLLYVPHRQGDFWLDATAGLGTITAIPNVLRGQLAFIVDGKGGQMLRVPIASPDQNTAIETQVYQLNETGGGMLRSLVKLNGDVAGKLRQELLETDQASQAAILSSPGFLLGRTFVPKKVSVMNLDSPGEPVTIKASLADKNLTAVRLNGALVFSPSLDNLMGGMLSGQSGSIPIDQPRRVVRHVDLIPPKGYRFDWTPLKLSHDDILSLNVSESRQGKKTRISISLTLNKEATDANEAHQLKRALDTIREKLALELSMVPGPNFDPISFLRKVAAEQPSDTRTQIHLGRLLISKGRYRAALQVLQSANAQGTENTMVWALLAAAHVQVGGFKDAEFFLRKVLQKDRGVPRLHVALALLLKDQGRLREVTEVLAEGHRRFPNHTGITMQLIEAYEAVGDIEKALAIATKLSRHQVNDTEIQFFVGRFAMRTGQSKMAENAFRQVLLIEPNHAEVLNDYAWVLRHSPDRLSDALSMVKQSISLVPTASHAWDTLAEIQYRLNRYHDALESTERALALSSEEQPRTLARRDLLLVKIREQSARDEEPKPTPIDP